jgi:hypothetical protein
MKPANRVCFDIEIANVFDVRPGEDLDDYGPFDISCAAALDESGRIRHWVSPGKGGKPAHRLGADMAREMLGYLLEQQRAGLRVCAWNGLSFDLRWLGTAAGDVALAVRIARELYDPMFQFFVQRGFPVALAKVAEGLGIKEKKLMGGADAPVEWERGNHELVLDYVAGDCRITDKVIGRIEEEGELRWRTQRGKVSAELMPELLRVRDLLSAPEPDTSWMDDPMPRSKFTGWLTGN